MKLARFVLATGLLSGSLAIAAPDPALYPRPADYTHLHWAEGFPGSIAGAPWRRVVETGHFAFVLDTGTMRIPHFGAWKNDLGYAEAAKRATADWQSLPPADLELTLSANGKTHRCTAGGPWTTHGGPRLIESGRLVQRGDVTDLVFTDDGGNRVNLEARFETAAWPDRLGLLLAARPGAKAIVPGEESFGFSGGGFGLDGGNPLVVPHAGEIETERFTLDLRVYVPFDYEASEKTYPWLVCKNRNEITEGNYGIALINGKAMARLNIGGGKENSFSIESREPLRREAWNHLVMSYDGKTLRLILNGAPPVELAIGRPRLPGKDELVFGRRGDNSGDGYRFRGVIDEIRWYDEALTPQQLQSGERKALREWTFRADGAASATRPREVWPDATLGLRLVSGGKEFTSHAPLRPGDDWSEAGLLLDPVAMKPSALSPAVRVTAGAQAVTTDPLRGWHRVALDGLAADLPEGRPEPRNDALRRVRLVLENDSDGEEVARLLLEMKEVGAGIGIGSPVTGMTAVLRDLNGEPTGLPVQLSKNWHNRPEGGEFAGQWFHGFTQLRLPARSRTELELTLSHAHWGGLPAASHAQLCLIGWGSNQLWDQSALGAWGESICYEPDQAQGQCSLLDVRPLLVKGLNGGGQWQWTNNVGGGDHVRIFAPDGNRLRHARLRTAYLSHGPCLTEVLYAGRAGDTIGHSLTASLGRTDDLVRAVYRLQMEVKKDQPFSRCVLFQIGADTYSYTAEKKMAVGNAEGLVREWPTTWGGDTIRNGPIELTGDMPWISLHEGVSRAKSGDPSAWANRGLVLREWKARLGGREAAPWMVERGTFSRGADTSTADLVPPPDVTGLKAGDFVEAVIELLILPQQAADYYGPNAALRKALGRDGNTWKLVHREATGNRRRVTVEKGELQSLHPAVHVAAENDSAAFTLAGGLAWVPVTISGLTTPSGHRLLVNGTALDQSVHGNDYWQTDYDPATRTWSLTWQVPAPESGSLRIALD
jgi:hypothetical protein